MQKKVKVIVKNGEEKEFEIPYGTQVKEILHRLNRKEEYIAAKINNEVTSLSFSIKVNSMIEFITIKNKFGMEVYRRSLSFLLAKVCIKLFPERRLVIGHSLGPGYYFEFENLEISEKDVKLIEEEMFKEVERNILIIRKRISYVDALEYFKETNKDDKYKLLLSLNMSKLSIYKCDDFFELFDGPMAIQTGLLKIFCLIYYKPGFILQFPTKSNCDKVAVFDQQRKVFDVYHESKKTGKVLNVDNVGKLNDIIMNKKK